MAVTGTRHLADRYGTFPVVIATEPLMSDGTSIPRPQQESEPGRPEVRRVSAKPPALAAPVTGVARR